MGTMLSSASTPHLLWTEWQNQVANQVASGVGHNCCLYSQGMSGDHTVPFSAQGAHLAHGPC